MRLLTGVTLVVLAVAGPGRADPPEKELPKVEQAKEKLAELSANNLTTALEAYHLNPQSGNTYPAELEDLARPPFGGTSFVKNGKADLLDPWGKPYKYATAKNEKGVLVPYIWSERTVGGKTRVVGTKPKDKA